MDADWPQLEAGLLHIAKVTLRETFASSRDSHNTYHSQRPDAKGRSNASHGRGPATPKRQGL